MTKKLDMKYMQSNYSIVEKSAEDLRRLAVIQTPVKEHQLTLVWKTRK